MIYHKNSDLRGLEGDAGADHEADALRTHTVEQVIAAVEQIVGLQPQADVAVEAVICSGVQVDDVIHVNE